jgi:hypothetical protein
VSKQVSNVSTSAAVGAAQVSSSATSPLTSARQSSTGTGWMVAVQVVAGAAALPLVPALPPVEQLTVTRPQRPSRAQTACAAIAAASLGALPEISTCPGSLPPQATKATVSPNPIAARMRAVYPN